MRPYTPNITQLQQANSTTYTDLIGLQMGLPRLPAETSESYLKRLSAGSGMIRTHPYKGVLNEINLQLGVVPKWYINLALPVGTAVSISIAGVMVDNNPTVPLLVFDADTTWNWRMLSSVAADLNAFFPATLLVPDGPAFQLARQTNSSWSFSENITGIQSQLRFTGIRVGSELFNQSVPAYNLTVDGAITFSTEPPIGTKITYNYITTPYNLVGSPVALIGLTDPEFASVATTPDSSLAYQVSEFIQSIMSIDRSYWAV